MENVVAARRLRKSMLREEGASCLQVLNDITNRDVKQKGHTRTHNIEFDMEQEEKLPKISLKLKNKLLIKTFMACAIVFGCLVGKLLFADILQQNKWVIPIITQYQKDYSKADICEKTEEMSKVAYRGLKYVIPENVANYISTNYREKVKPKIVTFDLKQRTLSLVRPKTEAQTSPPVVSQDIPQETRNGRGRACRRS